MAGPFALAAAVLAVVQGAPNPDEAGLQAVYDRMSAAYAQGRPDLLADAYAEDAVVFPSAAGRAPVRGREAIRTGPGAFLAQSAAAGGRLSLSFEITDRRRLGDAVVDVGLYRMAERRPDGACSITVGKFMTVLARDADGRWAFVADSDTPMPVELWTRPDPAVACAA